MKLKPLALISLNLSILAASLNLGTIPSYANNGSSEPPVNQEVAALESTVKPSEQRINLETLPVKQSESAKNLAFTGPLAKPSAPQLDQGIILKAGVKSFKDNIDLTVDKAELINLKTPISRVSISQSSIATVTMINPYQIQLLGNKVGVANLLIWPTKNSNAYTSVDIVVHRDVSALSRQLQAISPGLQVVPMAAEDSVILTGHADTVEASQMAVQLAKAFFVKDSASSQTKNNLNSQAPGSTLPTSSTNVINLIQVAGQPSTKLEMVRAKLKQIDPNINLDIMPGPDNTEKAVLTGRVQNPSQISEAVNTTSIFYGQLGMKVIAGPGGNSIRPIGTPTFQTSDTFSDNADINVLQGSVVTDATGNVISMLKLAHKPQVKCTIRFLDISRRDVNQLGAALTGLNGNVGYGSFSGSQSAFRPFSDITKATILNNNSASGWVTNSGGGSITGSALAQNFGAGTTQILTLNRNMTAALSAFVETNKIKTLAEPTLLMLSGEKASFMAGGEFPIPISGNNGQISVTFKQFGIRLNIIPTVTEDNKINLQVAPEVSAIDPANSIIANGIMIPGIRTRRMQSTLEVQSNQSLVLAGLFNQEETSMASRFPGIGDLPVIGAFFRQKNNNKLNNEMMVVITPQIIYDENVPQTAISSDAQKLFDNANHKKTQNYKP